MSLLITSIKSNTAKKYIDDFKIYINGSPPGSLELSIIIQDLIIIDVLSYMTNMQKGIMKTKQPTTSMISLVFFVSLFEMTSIRTCVSSFKQIEIPKKL